MEFKLDKIQYPIVETSARTQDINVTKHLKSSLGISCSLLKDSPKEFCIIFDIDLNNTDKEDSFHMYIRANAYFNATKALPENFESSDFAMINAPAIAFPYVRAFISNLTMNMGFNPIIFSTINFVELAKSARRKNDR